jgi:hypothetical protein
MERVHFERCHLIGLGVEASSLVSTDFVDSSLEQLRFHRCHLRHVSIGDRLDEVIFVECGFAASTITASFVTDVVFLDSTLVDVKLPTGRDGFVVAPERVREVLAGALRGLSYPGRERLAELLVDVDAMAVSECALVTQFGVSSSEATAVVDALLPYRLRRLNDRTQSHEQGAP